LSNSQKPYGIHLLKARNALEYGLDNRDELVEKAILKLEAFLDSEKDDPDALLKLSGLLKETGDTRGAIECYKRGLEVDPENQRAVRFLVYAYSEMGREDDAFRMDEKESPEFDGFHPRVSNPDVWKAWAFSDVGDFDRAALHMEKALTYMPEDMVNWEELEYYYIAIGQREKADECRDEIRSLRNMLS